MRAFTPHKDQIAPATPADVVPVAIPTETPATGTPSLGSAPLGAMHTPGPWTLTHVAGINFATQRFELRGMFGDKPNDYPIFNKGTSAIDGTTFCASPEDALLISLAPELADSLVATLGLLRKAQDILTTYLHPNSYDDLQCCNLLLELLDGPEQRAIETPARALLSKLKGS